MEWSILAMMSRAFLAYFRRVGELRAAWRAEVWDARRELARELARVLWPALGDDARGALATMGLGAVVVSSRVVGEVPPVPGPLSADDVERLLERLRAEAAANRVRVQEGCCTAPPEGPPVWIEGNRGKDVVLPAEVSARALTWLGAGYGCTLCGADAMASGARWALHVISDGMDGLPGWRIAGHVVCRTCARGVQEGAS